MDSKENKSSNATLHFMCGKMAAGKTTLSKRLEKEYNAVLICEDIWLQRLYPNEISNFEDYLKYARRLRDIIIPHVKELLLKGISVILDFPANIPVSRSWIKSIYESVNANHVLHYLDVPNEKCIEQLKKRNEEKPDGSMEMTVEQFMQITSLFVAPTTEEGFNILIHESAE
jgi:predicted kinase